MNHVFRALQSPNYRLFFIGQSISLTGTWMQQVAMSWLVYRLTNSAFLLGAVAFTTQIPAFVFSLFAGVIADRYSRRRVLIITQVLALVQALILTILVFTNTVVFWHIIVLSICLGIVNAFDVPVRHSFTVDMIERKEDLSNAIALNSTMFNIARLLGPSFAGVLIAAVGEGVCFLLNTFSYFAVLISLLAMRLPRRHAKPAQSHVFTELKNGFHYVWNHAAIKNILFLSGLLTLMGVPYQIFMPIFAKDIFHGGPRTLGFLTAMAGMGALIGAIYLAARKSVIGLGKVIAVTAGIFGCGLMIFSLSHVLWFSAAMTLIMGFSFMVEMASSNTVLQTVTDETKRGRVMSFYTLAFMGMAPFGSLLGGSLAHKIGAPLTLLCGGMCCVIGALLFSRKVSLVRDKLRMMG